MGLVAERGASESRTSRTRCAVVLFFKRCFFRSRVLQQLRVHGVLRDVHVANYAPPDKHDLDRSLHEKEKGEERLSRRLTSRGYVGARTPRTSWGNWACWTTETPESFRFLQRGGA